MKSFIQKALLVSALVFSVNVHAATTTQASSEAVKVSPTEISISEQSLGTQTISTQLSISKSDSLSDLERQDFIKANVLWIFYHELAHALIHQMDLPVLGKEEDAADQLAILLSDELWDENQADVINSYASSLFWLAGETALEQAPWWDEHSTDHQRHFTIACLYFGADPEKRSHVLETVNLPDERAELCIEERELLDRSWGEVLDRLTGKEFSQKLAFEKRGESKTQTLSTSSATAKLAAEVLEQEVEALNQEFSLPNKLSVVFMSCDEENAFYDPDKSEIQICTEYSDFLDRLYKAEPVAKH